MVCSSPSIRTRLTALARRRRSTERCSASERRARSSDSVAGAAFDELAQGHRARVEAERGGQAGGGAGAALLERRALEDGALERPGQRLDALDVARRERGGLGLGQGRQAAVLLELGVERGAQLLGERALVGGHEARSFMLA